MKLGGRNRCLCLFDFLILRALGTATSDSTGPESTAFKETRTTWVIQGRLAAHVGTHGFMVCMSHTMSSGTAMRTAPRRSQERYTLVSRTHQESSLETAPAPARNQPVNNRA